MSLTSEVDEDELPWSVARGIGRYVSCCVCCCCCRCWIAESEVEEGESCQTRMWLLGRVGEIRSGRGRDVVVVPLPSEGNIKRTGLECVA